MQKVLQQRRQQQVGVKMAEKRVPLGRCGPKICPSCLLLLDPPGLLVALLGLPGLLVLGPPDLLLALLGPPGLLTQSLPASSFSALP